MVSGNYKGGMPMLEFFFEKDTRLRQLRRGPLGPYMDGLSADLRRGRYSKSSARRILSLAARLSQFARASGLQDAAGIDTDLISRFLTEELAAEGKFREGPNVVLHVTAYLQSLGVLQSTRTTAPDDPETRLLTGYDTYLRDVRWLQTPTRDEYQRGARRLLKWYMTRYGNRPIGRLSGPNVLEYVTACISESPNRSLGKHVCCHVRSLLRYLGVVGLLAPGLERTVPRVQHWRLSSIPRHLPWPQVRKLIDSVDITRPAGLRDKAILLLMAMLGLRGGEVIRLELKHINWRAGEVRLPRTKSARERVLPIPQELGAALSDYILYGRPALDIPQVFLRDRAPMGALRSAGAVGAILSQHLNVAGLSESRATHLLRHSLATRMVNSGVPIKTIADVLGHASIDTTAIYTKVDLTRLRSAALPFPEGGVA